MNDAQKWPPEVLNTRRAVRLALRGALSPAQRSEREDPARTSPLALVALSGGADSLALAAALAAVAPEEGWQAGAIIVDHGLQDGSAQIAQRAAEQAAALGLHPVLVQRVSVASQHPDGLEAAARTARYRAFDEARASSHASVVLTAHTMNDQAEQVFLGLLRGSGTRSLAGIPPQRGPLLRPFLEVDRGTTERACAAQGLDPWRDPHNTDTRFTRVRVRECVLPAVETQLGAGVQRALARTAALAREDADALDQIAAAALQQAAEPSSAAEPAALAQTTARTHAPVQLAVAALKSQPAAVQHRMIRMVAAQQGGRALTREHTLSVARLVTEWRGQGPVYAPGVRVRRANGMLLFERQVGSPRNEQQLQDRSR